MANATNNTWIEGKVSQMLADLRSSGFYNQGIEDAIGLRNAHGYAWDVALKLSCDYWCSYTLKEAAAG